MRFLIINPPNLDVTLPEGISIFDWLVETKQIVLYYMVAEDNPVAKSIDLSPFINKLNSLNFERFPKYSSAVVKAYLELFYLTSKLFCEINSIKKDEKIFVSWMEGVESKIKGLFENITAYKEKYSMVHERDILILQGWLQLAKINLIFASFNVLKFEQCLEFLSLFESSISEIDWSVMPVSKNCILCNQCLAVTSLIKMPINIKLYGLLAKAILQMCESSDNPQEKFPVQLLEEVERVLVRADADLRSIETKCMVLKNAKPFIYFLLLFEAYFGKMTKYIAFSKHIKGMITELKGVAAKLDELTIKHMRAEIANGPLLQELIKSFPVSDVDKTEKKDKKKKEKKGFSAPVVQKEKPEKAQFFAEVSRCKQKQQQTPPPPPQQKQQSQKTSSHGESSLKKEPDKKIEPKCLSKKKKKAPGKKPSPIHQPQIEKGSKKQVERPEIPITTDVIDDTQDLPDAILEVSSSSDIVELVEIKEDVTKELVPEESVQLVAQIAVPQLYAEPVQLEEKPVSQPAKKQLICSLETALPMDVREKLLPILLPFGAVFVTGGSARKGIFSQCYPDKIYEASDVDLVINMVESGRCDSLISFLVKFGFKKSLVDEVRTYHPNSPKGKYVDGVFYPPVAAAFTTIIDIKIIALKAQEKPLPCFKIDTLSIEVFSKDEGRFYPTTEDFFDIVWNPLASAIKSPTIEDLIEHNTETVFRALRLMYIHKLYDSTSHDKLLKQICDAGNILKRQNFGQFNSMLRKFFCRGNAWGFMKCGSGDAFLAVRNAFLSILQPAFPGFCKTIMGSDSSLKLFILSELSEFDKDSSLDFNQRLDKIYALLLLPAYLKLSEQCSGKQGIDEARDFTRKAFSGLLKENFISSSSGVDSGAAWIERDGKSSAKSIIAEYLDRLQQKFKLSKPSITNGACCTFFNVAAKPFVPAALQKNPSCS